MIPQIRGKTAMVTGGTGSIGSEIVKQLLSGGAEKVVVFSRDEIKHFMLKKRIIDERLETVVGDVRDYNSIKRAFDANDFDIIYHAAAMKHVVVCDKFPWNAPGPISLGLRMWWTWPDPEVFRD